MHTKYQFTTPEIKSVEKEIKELQAKRQKLLAKAAKAKAALLCKDMASSKK